MRKRLVLGVLLLSISIGLHAQKGSNDTKIVEKAEKLLRYKNYDEALPLYEQLVENGSQDAFVLYGMAKCLKESSNINVRVTSLDYFEKAEKAMINPIPYKFYLDMGDAYLENEQIEQSISAYNKHIKTLGTDKRAVAETEKKVKTAQIAFKYIKEPRDVVIRRLEGAINTNFTEYNPVVSADESILAYTALRPNTGKTRQGDKFIEEIYISYNETGVWSTPTKVEIETQNNLGTAGISPDGQNMLIFLGDANGGSLYQIDKSGDKWSRPEPLGQNINSGYLETTASITPDGKTIYFASNRPGGYGGLDLYKAEKRTDGTWDRPINLGPEINSKANEDAPFIHPGQTILFFTSDGHDGMGGNDIFRAKLINGKWSSPENMGYPINTTANDNYFTLIADGTRGYFSSDRLGSTGGQDIYMMNMPEDFETIPLTLIKGTILEAESERPLDTKIYVIDNETGTKLDFVYHPNPETGEYLVILPPNKNYDMIIESQGFFPYTLNIDVPNQTYFYQLYQKIYLKTIRQFDVVVGQEVQVKNAFYDTQSEVKSDMRKAYESRLIDEDSLDVYELMGNLMEANDQEGMDYLLELIMMTNPIESVNFDEDSEEMQAAVRTYYFDESDTTKFEKKMVGDIEVLSLPTMFVTEEAAIQRQRRKENKSINYNQQLTRDVTKIYFDAGSSNLGDEYYKELDKYLNILNQNEVLGIEISGYASSEGNAEFNEKLSNERAISVLNYINVKGVVRRRIIARGYGVTEDNTSTPEESRRVEVRIVDLRDYGRL